MKIEKLMVLAIACLTSTDALAYKTEVHAIMTDEAARRSVLRYNSTWVQMGFPNAAQPLFIAAYQPESTRIWNDSSLFSAGQLFPKVMAFGADVEDTSVGAHLVGNSGFAWSRAFDHFFNPQNGAKLDINFINAALLALPGGQFAPLPNHTSPDWALESAGQIKEQEFSYVDAQKALFQVFTARNVAGSPSSSLLAMGRTLQTLGHVVHHIQDMAQPQHTRLDSHCDHTYCEAIDNVTYDGDDTSPYEVYTRDLIKCGDPNPWQYNTRGVYRNAESGPVTPVVCAKTDLQDWSYDWKARPVYLGSYPVVDAQKLAALGEAFSPRLFWTNQAKKGLANFSSQNFVSTDTAFGTARPGTDADLLSRLAPSSASLPRPNGQSDAQYGITAVKLSELGYVIPQPTAGMGYDTNSGNPFVAAGAPILGAVGGLDPTMMFISSTFDDTYLGVKVTNPRLVAYSVFNERFTKRGISRFTTNIFTMDDHAQQLIPRAVGYSAGLIDYFFRYPMHAEVVGLERVKSGSNDGHLPTEGAKKILKIRFWNDGKYPLKFSNSQIRQKVGGDIVQVPGGQPIRNGGTIPPGGNLETWYEWMADDFPWVTGTSVNLSKVFYNLVDGVPAAEAGLFFNIVVPPTTTTGCQLREDRIDLFGGSDYLWNNYASADAGLLNQPSRYEYGLDGRKNVIDSNGLFTKETATFVGLNGTYDVFFDALGTSDWLRITNWYGTVLYDSGGVSSGVKRGEFAFDSARDYRLKITVKGGREYLNASASMIETGSRLWNLAIGCKH